jgi:hypothetical protein
MDEAELDLLQSLDGAAYEMAPRVIVEFAVRRTPATPQRPHGISYALVLRPKAGGAPWVRFDNAHAVEQRGKRRKPVVYDHWHRTTHDEGPSVPLHPALQLFDDFWREVKRTLNEKDILNDL